MKVGDIVVIYPIIGCDECESCQLGKEQICLGKSPFIGFSLPGKWTICFIDPGWTPNLRFIPGRLGR